jgi:hypothetical protein
MLVFIRTFQGRIETLELEPPQNKQNPDKYRKGII